MARTATIGFVFIEPFADWEYGLLAASAVEWFGARAVSLTPGIKAVRSIAGFTLSPERGTTPPENADLDAIAVIGSDSWASEAAPDLSDLLQSVAARGGVVGGICGGTLALARAGIFADAAHTSNGRDWILGHLPDYAGSKHYQDVPHAVADGHVISAPGTAPGTFALAFLGALYPDKTEQIAEMRGLLSREYRGAQPS
ncbi:DJ-1/PfpI family protein [Aquamicrobium sp. LC103]|uniref:DJ-1/PfpI family protein n=1 Tax=Aquamicrobium sp. LC103 TaxID=1120658 RepID=UPI00063E8D7F|nr:DJ-1/PfpI family protein [Aquamicrobium sp. LC103]TKT75411.1 glutamine amidotransferase [Aquamicrobium sp. LC103]